MAAANTTVNPITPYRLLLVEIGKSLDDGEISTIVFVINPDDEKIRNTNTAMLKWMDLMRWMESNGKISEKCHVDGLINIMKIIKRQDLVDKIHAYKENAEPTASEPGIQAQQSIKQESRTDKMNAEDDMNNPSSRNMDDRAPGHGVGMPAISQGARPKSEIAQETTQITPKFDKSPLSDFSSTGNGDEDAGEESGSGNIRLHSYQMELAQPGCEGVNTIICAPTGSGKTFTAAYVCNNRRTQAKIDRRSFKAVFIVCIRNLVPQQIKAISQIIPADAVGSADGIDLSELLKPRSKKDVIVMTAQILVNNLKERALRISDLDMIILDECHHTNMDHPYNTIMRWYQEERKENCNRKLPQILGLTASIGVGESSPHTFEVDFLDEVEKHLQQAVKHYVRICANMDCTHIKHVVKYRDEMLEINPEPNMNELILLESRSDKDGFQATLSRLCNQITTMQEFVVIVKDAPMPYLGSQDLITWIAELQNDCIKVKNRTYETRATSQACEMLRHIAFAAQRYIDHRGKDVLAELDKDLEKLFGETAAPMDLKDFHKILRDAWHNTKATLDLHAARERHADCPMLDGLADLIDDIFIANPDSKGIILTKTVFSARSLLHFVKENEDLAKHNLKPQILVGQSKKEGTMTDAEQRHVIKKFRDDDTKLLIATDVAHEGLDIQKCNFVIRYNYISNDVGSVQSKGRARMPDSDCHLLLPRNSGQENRELKNMENEYRMLKALDIINKINQQELRNNVEQAQDKLWEEYQASLKKKKNKKTETSDAVTVVCIDCQAELCSGNEMVKKGNHYICGTPDFGQTRVKLVETRRKELYNDIHIGYSKCRQPGCGRKMGPVMMFKDGSREYGYCLGIKNVMLKITNRDYLVKVKQWSKVPFSIQEEAYTD